MNLALFSSPGERDDIRYILEAARPHLAGRPDARVAYLPMASLYGEEWLARAEKSFEGLARLEMLNTEMMELPEMEAVLRRAQLVYIPGGNTFLLNHRLHISRLMSYLSKKVQAGLPLIAFGAGTVLCGPNILTSHDLNSVATPHFEGLNVTPFNFHVHYTGDLARDNWLMDYHVFHDNPVIMMADGSFVKSEGRKTQLVSGDAWLLRKGGEKERIKPGALIPA
ncbi:MAG TPA: Type 1 glutamine amidotransferase-like domain-containing protein [Anaerolineales bacterium]|nr:Type 1 glutamine amidotransferase-like domain-containing protein [Anaerolineales bacterium]